MKKFFIKALAVLMIVVTMFTSAPMTALNDASSGTATSITAEAASKKKIKLKKTKPSVYVGKKYTLKLLDKKGKIISAKKIKWKSSNKKIATVNKSGVVTGKKAGKVKITATYKKKKYTATVTVKPSVSVSKSNLVFEAGSTSKKSVTVTYKESGSVYWEILEGEDIITCQWSRKWKNDKTTLYVTPKKGASGKARIKIYSENKPSRCDYIDVEVKSAYTLTVKNDLPCYVSNYESRDYYDKGEKLSTVKINRVDYEVIYGDSFRITVDFEAFSSYYDEGYYYIKYRITDEDGYVIEFDRAMTERMFEGDRAREEINVYDLAPGNYTIEFIDHYANA